MLELREKAKEKKTRHAHEERRKERRKEARFKVLIHYCISAAFLGLLGFRITPLVMSRTSLRISIAKRYEM
jgi:hypothetical protein